MAQLEMDLAEQLRDADLVLFVDATINDLDVGWTWCKIYPETNILPYLTHHLHPTYLLGLIKALYQRFIVAWLVSIQGYEFDFGEGLSPRAEKMAPKVRWEILQFIQKKIDRKKP